ncbi:hypothetical protein Xoosp13_84 [Xanthomonas phage Xoo-sp13]|nr:hypothetical protein Xoosp13_84 [Xanthomonas phage Xoo-sp13]
MPTITYDQTYINLQRAYEVLKLLADHSDEPVVVNRSYIRDDTIGLNFKFKRLNYLLVMSNDKERNFAVWYTSRQGHVIKKPYTTIEIYTQKFIDKS